MGFYDGTFSGWVAEWVEKVELNALNYEHWTHSQAFPVCCLSPSTTLAIIIIIISHDDQTQSWALILLLITSAMSLLSLIGILLYTVHSYRFILL